MIVLTIGLGIGFGLSLYFNYLLFKALVKQVLDEAEPSLIESQSDQYEAQRLHDESFRETKGEEQTTVIPIRIAITDSKAYWIIDSQLMEAPLDDDGDPDFDLQKPTDTLTMQHSDVEMLLEVVDELKKD